MNYLSTRADQDRDKRRKSKEFLFITIIDMEKPDEIYGIGMGNQIQEFMGILGNMEDDKKIYKVFKDYIKTKNMNVTVLKEPSEWHRQVDKLYKEENNLICISVVENKIPPMDLYYSTKPQQLKDDFIKFYNNYSK